MRLLRNRVHVKGQWIPAGTAESDLPDGVKIPNPKAWTETDDSARIADTVTVPPKSGSGSSVSAWRSYALAHDLDESDLEGVTTKAQIIEVLTVAGVPTE